MTTTPENRRPPEGWWAEFTPLTFDRARIIVTDGGGGPRATPGAST